MVDRKILILVVVIAVFGFGSAAALLVPVGFTTNDDVKLYTITNIVEFENQEAFIEELRCDPGDKVITGYFKNIGDTRISYSSHSNSFVFDESGAEVWRWQGSATSGAMTVEFTIICAKVVQNNIIGGMLIQPDNFALFLAYGIANAVWMAPLVIGIGAGVYLTKAKWKKN